MFVRPAAVSEVPALVSLINRAFALERFFVDHDRIDQEQVLAFFATGTFLLACDENGIAACVYVEQRGNRGYFGLLSVDPDRQKNGFGKTLVEAAEDHCRQLGCTAMDMRIVNLRTELPAFYHRLGYVEAGTERFPPDVETLLPCHFVRMSKPL